jgi:hypothetical protein
MEIEPQIQELRANQSKTEIEILIEQFLKSFLVHAGEIDTGDETTSASNCFGIPEDYPNSRKRV